MSTHLTKRISIEHQDSVGKTTHTFYGIVANFIISFLILLQRSNIKSILIRSSLFMKLNQTTPLEASLLNEERLCIWTFQTDIGSCTQNEIVTVIYGISIPPF